MTFGCEPFSDFFDVPNDASLADRIDALFSALSAMLSMVNLPEREAAPLANHLPDMFRLAGTQTKSGYAGNSSELTTSERLHIALAASFLVQGDVERRTLHNIVVGAFSLDHLRKKLAPALLAPTHSAHFVHENSLFPEILSTAPQLLESEIGNPLEHSPNFAWMYPITACITLGFGLLLGSSPQEDSENPS